MGDVEGSRLVSGQEVGYGGFYRLRGGAATLPPVAEVGAGVGGGQPVLAVELGQFRYHCFRFLRRRLAQPRQRGVLFVAAVVLRDGQFPQVLFQVPNFLGPIGSTERLGGFG